MSISSAMRAARRILLFTGVPALGAFSPLIVLPALTSALGASGWASLAVAQASGAFGALFLNWAWNVQGPSLVAGAAPADRARLYAESMRSRALSALVALPAAAVVAFAVAPSYRGSAALMAATISLAGMLPSWYFIGTASPVRLACFDALPRIFTAAASALLLAIAPSDWTYPTLLLMSTVVAVGIGSATLSGRVLHLPGRDDLRAARARWFLVMSGLISSGYTTLTIPIVAILAPAAVPVFAAAARFQGYGTLGLSAVTNSAQAWVSAHGIEHREASRRRLRALLGNSAAGLAAAALLVVVLPSASHLLFSGTVTLHLPEALLVGGTVLMLAVSMSTTFHLLIPTGRTRVVATSGIVTSAIGVPLLVVLTLAGGAVGALAAVLVAETISASIQLAVYFAPHALQGAPRGRSDRGVGERRRSAVTSRS